MAKPPKIVVTGANGQLGSELRDLAAAFPQFEFICVSHETLPIDQAAIINDFFDKHRPAYCINCAAYTAVDKAETEKELAYTINATAVGELAAVCRKNECRLIHISTDYVFDGRATIPYREDDITDPQNVYGTSKLEGERQAIRADPLSIIIRSSWVYSYYGKNFVKTMLKLMKEKDHVNVVNDQFGSPTYAADLALAILQIVSSNNWIPGIYHYCNKGVISWYDFAVAIRQLSHASCAVHPIETSEYPTPARRPAYSVLATDKIRNTYHIDNPGWKDSLKKCLDRIAGFPQISAD